MEKSLYLIPVISFALVRSMWWYSWDVLNHPGAMWRALENVASLVAGGGQLFIAIYNDQGRPSKTWLRIKRIYNALPGSLRWLVLLLVFVRLWGPLFCEISFGVNLS